VMAKKAMFCGGKRIIRGGKMAMSRDCCTPCCEPIPTVECPGCDDGVAPAFLYLEIDGMTGVNSGSNGDCPAECPSMDGVYELAYEFSSGPNCYYYHYFSSG